MQHVAIVYGRVGDGRNMPVRLHRANAVTDVFEGGKTIAAVMKRFAKEGRGVLVYLRDGTAGVPTTRFSDTEARFRDGAHTQWREVGLGAQILRDLGVVSIRNLATSTRSYVGLSGFGIEMMAEETLDG